VAGIRTAWLSILSTVLGLLFCKVIFYKSVRNLLTLALSRVDTEVNFRCDFTTHFDAKNTCKSLQTEVPENLLKFMTTLKLISWSKWD